MNKVRKIILAMASALLFAGVVVQAADGVARPKIYGIAFVVVKVTDMEKSKAFYGNELRLQAGGASCKGVTNPCFSINAAQHVELVKTGVGDTGSYLPEIGLSTNDVVQMRNYLTAKGVTASKIMQRADGTKYIEVLDPEQHKIVFVEGAPLPAGAEKITGSGVVSDRLIHAGFVVKDAKAESRFYEDILGFRVYWHGGFKEDETNWYMVQVPDGDNWLEYMLMIRDDASQKELGVQNHFSLGVVDIHATMKELEARGFKAAGPPVMGRDGKWQLTLYDPDWTRAEVMEFTPTGTICCAQYTGPHPKP